MAHPLALGILLGFGTSILVSWLELLGSSYTFYRADPTVALVILLASIPSVFALTAGLGAVFLRSRYGNTLGLGIITEGAIIPVAVFFVLWAVLLFLFALIAGCVTSSC